MAHAVLEQNYFQLLGLQQGFEVDEDRLQKNYLKLQSQFHPDRYVNANAQEQRLVMQLTAQINQARTCLLDPVARAQYLLELEEVTIPSEQTIDDAEFLIQQMEWREQAQTLSSSAADDEQKAAFVSELQTVRTTFVNEFVQAYSRSAWPEAVVAIAKMQFMRKLIKQLN